MLPAVTRSLRRVPEVALGVLASFARTSPLDLSPYAEEIMGVLIQQLRTKVPFLHRPLKRSLMKPSLIILLLVLCPLDHRHT